MSGHAIQRLVRQSPRKMRLVIDLIRGKDVSEAYAILKFNKKLKQGEMNEAQEAAATGVGILGHLARCVVFGLIGIFLVKAAWEFDSKQARGLDGALLEVVHQPYGGLLLGAVAVGLLAYGLFCFVQARYRRI